ncbi:AAA family ATPase [Leisingera sp.]|uniref:AAA family ATPase n=1 Tax=Leisingera sp. TaxID=1879318 RepID=UPI002B26B53C|nr:AAA family ATPase [Leisingera sp.]
MSRSLLIHGEPGTGKTVLAGAIAASAGVPLIQRSFGAWQAQGHLGDMLAAMLACFRDAKDRVTPAAERIGLNLTLEGDLAGSLRPAAGSEGSNAENASGEPP